MVVVRRGEASASPHLRRPSSYLFVRRLILALFSFGLAVVGGGGGVGDFGRF